MTAAQPTEQGEGVSRVTRPRALRPDRRSRRDSSKAFTIDSHKGIVPAIRRFGASYFVTHVPAPSGLPQPVERRFYATFLGAEPANVERAIAALADELPEHAATIGKLSARLRSPDFTTGPGGDVLGRLRQIRVSLGQGDRYEHIGDLGAGGLGAVTIVRDRLLGRKVARKSIHPKWGTHLAAVPPPLLHRFADEAQIAAQLRHPAIPPIHDIGLGPSGLPFFTMRHLRGHTLTRVFERHRARDPRWPLVRCVRVLVEIGEAIAYAHGVGVLHRDLKPDNVIVGRFGEVCVIDWGLAKSHRSTSMAGVVAVDREGAMETGVVGSPGYMAPEQGRGEAHPGVDVFSLAAILHVLLAGAPPVVANDRTDFPIANTLRRRDRQLAAICARGLAPRPDRRYPSMAALLADLRAYWDGARLDVTAGGIGQRCIDAMRRLGGVLRSRSEPAFIRGRDVEAAVRQFRPDDEELPPLTVVRPPDRHDPGAPSRETMMARGDDPASRLDAIRRLGGDAGRFQLAEMIGKGGMSEVIAAEDRWLRRRVAIKLVPVPAASDARDEGWQHIGREMVVRLLDEARVSAQLDHPSVLSPSDMVVLEDGRLAIVMPLAARGTLSTYARQHGPRGWRATVPLLLQASRGLAFAHGKGVVHADVKPHNILLGDHDDAYLVDWGLALLLGPGTGAGQSHVQLQRGPGFSERDAIVTNLSEQDPATIMGTPRYMAPEQQAGVRHLRPSADVYGLGCSLHELLAGSLPWDGTASYSELMRRKAEQDPPPVLARNPAAPSRLARVCDRAMQRDPAARHQSAGEFALALEDALRRS